MLRIAFLGLGAIGSEVMRRVSAWAADVEVVGALVLEPGRERAVKCPLFATVDEMLAARPDLVVECARQRALETLGPKVLESGASLIAASVGALAADGVLDALNKAAKAGRSQLFIPAGALAGIDALAAAKHSGVSRVTYIRRASPSTWVKSGALSAEIAQSLGEARTIFEGSAREAAVRYPKNANVAATVALAGLGFDRTGVTLIADPAASANVHTIVAEGEFGSLRTELSARALPGSTSSAIVAGSLVRAILSRTERIAV